MHGSKYYKYFSTAKDYASAENSCADNAAWVMMPKTAAEVEIFKTLVPSKILNPLLTISDFNLSI